MKTIRYILSLLVLSVLTGCYPGEDLGINVTINVDNVQVGLCRADVSGSYIINEGNPTVTEVGFCWAGYGKVPTVNDNKVISEQNSAKFSVRLSSLNEKTTYVVRPYIVADGFYVYGNTDSFTTPEKAIFLPTLDIVELVENGLDKVTVSSSITFVPSEYPVSEVGFIYTDQNVNDFELGKSGVQSVQGTLDGTKFIAEIPELLFSTNYYVRSYAKNEAGIAYGNTKKIRTLGDEYKPNLGVPEVTKSMPTSLEVSCKVSEVEDTKSLEAVFEYNELGYESDTIVAEVSNGVMTAKITGLTPSSYYYIRAKATNKYGSTYSSETLAMTSSGAESKPKVSAPKVSEITHEGATLESIVTIVDKEYKPSSGGFEYSTSSYFTSAIAKSASIVNDTILQAKFDDLDENKTYYVRAYINSDLGTVYSSAVSFNTIERKPTVSEVNVKKVTRTTIELSALVKPYDSSITLSKAGVEYRKKYYSSYTKVTGTIDGDSVSVTLSDLDKNTTYDIRTFALSNGTYYYSEATDVTTKSDDDYTPTFGETVASDITMTSFKLTSSYQLAEGSSAVESGGFQCYQSSSDYYIDYGELYEGTTSNGSITLDMSDLKSDRDYQVRPYLTLEDGTTHYGETITVTTYGEEYYAPTASIVTVTDVMMSSVKLKATVKEVSADYPITEAGFQYYQSSDSSYVSYGNRHEVTIVNGVIEMDLSSLKVGKPYQVRAYVVCSSGTYYGETVSFETLSESALPTIICDDVSAVDSTSFTVEAEVMENNKLYPIEEAGFLYIKASYYSSTLTMDTNDAIRKPIAIVDGKIKMTVSELEEDATYLLRAYVLSGDEIIYNENTIKVYTDMNKYIPEVGSVSVTNEDGIYVATCTATVSKVFPVKECGFVYSTSTSSPTLEDNTGYAIATLSGTEFKGGLSLTKPSTGSITYYVRGYAKNEHGIKYSSNYKSVSVSWK